MSAPLRLRFATLASLASLAAAGPAAAQVNSDFGLQAGVAQRVTTGADTAVSTPKPGPMVQAQAHVALFPLIRLGVYAAWDMSPVSGYGTRNFYEGGLRLKLIPPLLSHPWKTYAFVGLGGAYARQDGFNAAGSPTPSGVTPSVAYGPVDGVLLEVPLGLGLAYKIRKGTEVFVELAGRLGVAFLGDIYSSDNTASGQEPQISPSTVYGPFQGQDSFALSLSLGVSLGD